MIHDEIKKTKKKKSQDEQTIRIIRQQFESRFVVAVTSLSVCM